MPTPVETPNTRPATRLRAVTKSDSTDLRLTDDSGKVAECRSLYVGGAGDVAILASGDTAAVTLTGVAAGSIIPVEARKVMSTGTTATSIVALY